MKNTTQSVQCFWNLTYCGQLRVQENQTVTILTSYSCFFFNRPSWVSADKKDLNNTIKEALWTPLNINAKSKILGVLEQGFSAMMIKFIVAPLDLSTVHECVSVKTEVLSDELFVLPDKCTPNQIAKTHILLSRLNSLPTCYSHNTQIRLLSVQRKWKTCNFMLHL